MGAPVRFGEAPCADDFTFLQHHCERTVPPMRRPDKTELEFTMLMFIVLAPLGYWAVRALIAFVGN
jgi:hypothetical protein